MVTQGRKCDSYCEPAGVYSCPTKAPPGFFGFHFVNMGWGLPVWNPASTTNHGAYRMNRGGKWGLLSEVGMGIEVHCKSSGVHWQLDISQISIF